MSTHVTRGGGITGLTLVARIFNGDDLSQFLDFNDGVFKSAGHTTPTVTLPPIDAVNAPGVYGLAGGFDFSAITIPTATQSLLFRYDITAGGEVGDDVDTVELTDEVIRGAILNDATRFAGGDIDAAITSRESEVSAAARAATNTTEHGTTLTAIGL